VPAYLYARCLSVCLCFAAALTLEPGGSFDFQTLEVSCGSVVQSTGAGSPAHVRVHRLLSFPYTVLPCANVSLQMDLDVEVSKLAGLFILRSFVLRGRFSGLWFAARGQRQHGACRRLGSAARFGVAAGARLERGLR
jgi:hypothetical protein